MIKRILPQQLFPQPTDSNEVFLPQEIIQNIFKFLNKKTFFTIRLVCHKWEEISEFLWKDLYKTSYAIQHFIPNEKDEDWKNMFLERSKILKFVHMNIKKSKSIFKTNSEAHLNKGFEHLYRLEYDRALEAFARAAMEKENARAYEGLTRVYFHRKNYTNVLIFAEHCLKLSPINPGEIFYMRGKALVGLNRLKEALKDYESSIKYLGPVKYLNLNTTEIYKDKMLLNLELGNYDSCLFDCKSLKVKYSDDLSVDPFFNCAKILFDKKMYQQTERFLSNSTTKTKEFYLLSMRVQVGLGNYEEALEFFCKYEEKAKIEGEDHSITNETYLDIGITLFMNYEVKEAINYFVKSFDSTSVSKDVLLKASQLTYEASNSQIDCYDDYFMTIHISWSFYYFFCGLVGYFTSLKDVTDGKELCLNAITNFTRSITLNPTLPESFFYRAVLRCYLESVTQVNSDKFISENPVDDEKRKTRSGRNTRRFNAIIGTKIVSSNFMKESLNDLMNANALTTISYSKTQSDLPLLISILKSYVLISLKREKDALLELEKSKKMDKQEKYFVEFAGLNAAISKEEKDILLAFELEYKKKELSFPSFEDKFSYVLLQVIRNLKYKK